MARSLKLILGGIFFLFILALISYLLVINGVIMMNNPSRIIYPIHGVDVSHHQGKIDWKLAKEDGVDFAIIKATEGGDHKDKRFGDNWSGAKNAGIVVGAYHYYSFCKDPLVQAVNFINAVPFEEGMLPPAIDLEYDNNCNTAVPVKTFKTQLMVFIKEVKNQYKVNPIIYCNEDFYNKYLNDTQFSDCLFWVRNTYRQPALPGEVSWKFWQHTAKGTIKGIDGFTDMNVFNGRTFEFEELLIPIGN